MSKRLSLILCFSWMAASGYFSLKCAGESPARAPVPIPFGFDVPSNDSSVDSIGFTPFPDKNVSALAPLPVYRVVSEPWTAESVRDFSKAHLDGASVEASGSSYKVELEGLIYRFYKNRPGVFLFIEDARQDELPTPNVLSRTKEDYPEDEECKEAAIVFWRSIGYEFSMEELVVNDQLEVSEYTDSRRETDLVFRRVVHRRDLGEYEWRGLATIEARVNERGAIIGGLMYMPKVEFHGKYPLRSPKTAIDAFAKGEGWHPMMRSPGTIRLTSTNIVYRTTQGFARPCYELYGVPASSALSNESIDAPEKWIGSIDAVSSDYLTKVGREEGGPGPNPFVVSP